MTTQSTPTRPTTTTALSGKEGVCSIEVCYVEWVWQQPWQRCKQERAEGSGFVISERRIITNAHVVASAIDIRIRLHGSPRRFPAQISVFAPDVDLAVLKIEEQCADEFFGSKDKLDLEFADCLPALQERVCVVGFPAGGRTVCVTEGVVSRIDDLLLASPSDTSLVIQIDAAINPGNSGGPAFNENGKVTGVAFCKSSDSGDDNIGYVIPSSVVRAFLGRCSPDGCYTLSPSVPYRWHSLENRSLRLAHDVPDDVHGILLTDVSPTVGSALQKGDVLTKIDDSELADDGQVVLRGDELIQHRYLLRGKHHNQATVFSVYRNGQHIQSEACLLEDIPNISVRWVDVDHLDDYLILGALVLLPMSYSLMRSSKAPVLLQGTYNTWSRRWPGDWDSKEGLVVLSNILAHELSFAYERPWRRVMSYNGTSVQSMRHLRDLWEESCRACSKSKGEGDDGKKHFVRIELEHDDDIVFEVQAAMDAQAEILETHQIPKASVIRPLNPKYSFSRKGTPPQP